MRDRFHVWWLWKVSLPFSSKFVPIVAFVMFDDWRKLLHLFDSCERSVYMDKFVYFKARRTWKVIVIDPLHVSLLGAVWAQELIPVQCLLVWRHPPTKKNMENSLYRLAQHSKVMPCFPNEFIRLQFPAISSFCVISLLDKRDCKYQVFVFSLGKCLHCISSHLSIFFFIN